MRASGYAVATFLALLVGSEPAHACRAPARLELDDVRSAEVIVVGRIANYGIVLDPVARQRREKMLASPPNLPPELLKDLEEQTSFLSDYARFDVLVDEVLVGEAPETLHVTWDNSTFGEPEAIPTGQYLVALRDPRSPPPPLRGPSATILANPEPATLTVLQAPCSTAFIFTNESNEANAIRKMLPGLRR